MWARTGAHSVLLEIPGRRPFARPRQRWEDNIEMDLLEVGCEVIDWLDLSQDRDRYWADVNAVINFRVAENAENFLTC
jgi:hypothetical protein